MCRLVLVVALPLLVFACALPDPNGDPHAELTDPRGTGGPGRPSSQAPAEGLADTLVILTRDPGGRRAGGRHGEDAPTTGELRRLDAGGRAVERLPLRRTDVRASVCDVASSVRVRQTFGNPHEEPIDAVYLLPLPREAGVHDFVLTIGDRRIRGVVREREEARRLYERARAGGYEATLLSREYDDVFAQRVSNLAPGATVDVEIAYVHAIHGRDGVFELRFPNVVGPRALARAPGLAEPASRPIVGASERELAVSVALETIDPIRSLASPSHEHVVERRGTHAARVEIDQVGALANRDVVLRWSVRPEDGVYLPFATAHVESDGPGSGTLLVTTRPGTGTMGWLPRDAVRLEAEGVELVDPIPPRLGDLFEGRRHVCAVRFVGDVDDARIWLVGAREADGEHRELRARVSLRRPRTAEEGMLRRFWAYAAIRDAEERARASGDERWHRVARDLALAHGFASRRTSLVAVDATGPKSR